MIALYYEWHINLIKMITISNWIQSFQGMIHAIFAVVGLLSGAYLLIATKGSRLHFYIGRVFGVSLLIVNFSALFIYDFNDGRVGPFHFLIPVSLFFLLFGWIPMLRKKKSENYISRHIIGMIGASLGLWAAGATEYYFREMVTEGMSKGNQILNSFFISLPFAFLITILITIYINRQKNKV